MNISIQSKTRLFGALLILTASFFAVVGVSNISEAFNKQNYHRMVCASPSVSDVSCLARIKTDRTGTPAVTTLPKGYGPAQFHTAYNIPMTSETPAAIAVVAAYDHKNIKSDLDIYNKTFGLPVFPSCSVTITTACFTKVDQRGGTRYPKADAGWALEIAMDVEVAHQACPNCKLILVEADSASYTNLMTAVDRARIMGATVISNSYGSSEFAGETAYDSHFNVPGVAFIFSSGDSGYGTSYPAASPYVTAVGGTTLNLASDNTRLSETVWSGAGSGCSLYEKKPAFQTDSGCANRTIADVSAVADPATGAAVYSSIRYSGKTGWFVVGGTSLSAPLIAGIYGSAGNVTSAQPANSMPYTATSGLYDVVAGANGTCSVAYLCTGLTGFDGPTGLGAPNGISAF
jgi:subtilase family serine protease